MKTNNIKKLTAVALSGAMILGSTVTAFAANPTSDAGTGNILSYSVESVIVPTSIKIALNPQGYTITKKAAITKAADAEYTAFEYSEGATEDVKEEEFRENKGYLFTRSGEGTEGDPYAFAPAGDFDKTATYYKETTPAASVAAAVTAETQIVSFNYGIANFSTADRDVNVSFVASSDAVSNAAGKEAITFVDTLKKAEAYDETENADGAKVDELKMYLAVVAAKELPKMGDGSTAFGITEVTGGKDITNVTKKALADISMEKAASDAGAVAFTAGTGDTYAKADIAFKLGKAEYKIRDYDNITWETTQADLAKMTEIKTLGDITGFTFIGAMNPNVDWTTANVTALTFTPTYTVSKITDKEEAVTGGYKQIKTADQISAEADVEATTAANNFKSTYETLLAKTTETVAYEDLDDINTALDALEALSEAAQGKLTAEKATLEGLKTAAAAKAFTDATCHGEWEGEKLWLAADADTGFASDTVTVEVKGKTGDFTAFTNFTYSDGWVGIEWSAIETAIGGASNASPYSVRITDGTTRYTYTGE